MEGSEISIHHAFYWQKCLITHQIKQDGQPGSASVQRKNAPFKLQRFLVQSVLMMPRPRSSCELILVNHAQHCDRFMPGKLCGKFCVGSSAWCWANVCGGICRWRTCMSCFDPDGPGQCSGDGWGRRKERFLVHTTGFPSFWHIYCPAQSVISFCSYTACSALHAAWDLQCFSSLPFTSLLTNFCHIPLSMSEIVYFCGYVNDPFLSGEPPEEAL